MCGINGLINIKDAARIINRMNSSLAHRGPDAGGVFNSDNVSLGHRRLSIIDLSARADQPMVKDGLVIVYNGEVYNFGELKKELESLGVNFVTASDTEVVLEAFRRWRQDSFSRLLGMFAFCIYDTSARQLFLVRDHFGIKPLFYSFSGDNRSLLFSSELKALVETGLIERRINKRALAACLNYLWVPSSESILADAHKLPAAHYMSVLLGRDKLEPALRCYWELKPEAVKFKDEADLAGRLRQVMEESVRRHMISDVPVGAFLSGGLDSSYITALAKKNNPDLSTYTISICSRDKAVEKMPDDNLYARVLAEKLKINHTDVPVEPDVVKYLESMVYHLDEPIGDPAAINTYLICRLARERGIKVLLSGMGADEIFAGYRRQYAVLLAQKFNALPGPCLKLIRSALNLAPVRLGGWGLRRIRWAKRLFSFAGMPFDQAYMRSYSYYSQNDLSALLAGACDSQIEALYQEHARIFEAAKGFDDVNKMCYTDIQMFMNGLNLTYSDRASMAVSVEVRVPFIDRRVIEFAMAIPGRYKLKGKRSKHILKAAARGSVPDNIIERPKASFGMPIRSWISRDLKDMVDGLLSRETIKRRGLLDPGIVRDIIDNDRKGLEDNAYQIYQLLTLELWCRRFLDDR